MSWSKFLVRDREIRRKIDAEKRALWDLEREIAEISGMPGDLYEEVKEPEDKDTLSGNGGKWKIRPCDKEDNPLCVEEYGQAFTP